MKYFKFLIITLVLINSSILFAANTEMNMDEYDTLFVEISDKRVGIDEKSITKVRNPFLMQYAVAKKDGNTTIQKEVVYYLYAILGNKAKINDKWYSLNDTIGYYKLSQIKSNSVLLKSANHKQELFIRKHNAKNVTFSSN